MLTEAIFFDTLRQGLWIATITSVPILTAALVAGVVVGLFQALTSIQEMTLTFVPKLACHRRRLLDLDELHDRNAGVLLPGPDHSHHRRGLDMETASYTTLTRQSGLMREMQVIANNIANTATTGFRQEGLIFAEYVAKTDMGSISMATAQIHDTSTLQGTLTQTGGQFDVGIQGDGFFLIQTPQW